VQTGPLFRLESLTKRYPGVTALDDLTVEVPRGLVGLVGANGAGKTTMFRLMLGLARPSEGRLEVCGVDVAADPIEVRSRLGYMPEHECLPLDQTAADVVATFGELSGLPARDARQRASDILDLVGLDEARFRPISGFSTGMRQRTKLAQALVGDPELVLLDEPTAGLDPVGREEMLALVARLGTFGISVLMATHLLDDVQQAAIEARLETEFNDAIASIEDLPPPGRGSPSLSGAASPSGAPSASARASPSPPSRSRGSRGAPACRASFRGSPRPAPRTA
jgi:ABC-2 type transport system ATP-binding protein